MKYLGGKARLAKHIVPLMPAGGAFFEPFCGGLNITAGIRARKRVVNDANSGLITLYRALQAGYELPNTVDEALYARYKANQDASDPLTAFIGIGCSFGAKWFGGFARGSGSSGARNYALEAKRGLAAKISVCADVQFFSEDYRRFMRRVPGGAVVYCDPPYKGTTGYGWTINHEEFYRECRLLKGRGCRVFVSEYDMPHPFRLLRSFEVRTSIDRRGDTARVEKLYEL